MSINAITFGSPVYSPAFAVSSGDVGVIKLRSRETAPLSHETLDENFTNLANKINEILGLNTHLISVGTDGKIAFANLSLSAGTGLNLSGTGLFTHGARGSTMSGYSSSDLTSANLKFVDALHFDDLGHVKGYKTGTLSFNASGHIGVSNTGNAVTIASSAYGSGDSPSFGTITASKLHLETSTATDILRFGPDGRWGFQRTNDDSRYVSFSRQMNNTAKEVFTIDGDTSYVGIGSTTPFAQLTVADSASKVQLEVDPDADRVLISSYNRSGTPAPKPLKFSASAYSFSDGNVGISTANPSTTFDINQPKNDSDGNPLNKDVLMSFSKGETGEAVIGLSGGSSQVLLGSLADDLCIRSNGNNIRFGTASATRTDMTIDSNGNIGIGTTSPSSELTVNGELSVSVGDGTPNDMCLLSGTVSTSDGNNTVNGSGTNFNRELVVGDEVYINLVTYTVASIASDTQMAVTPPTGYSSNGGFYRVTKRQLIHADKLRSNLGVGTTTPSAKLDVRSLKVNEYAFMASRADGTRLGAIYRDANSNGTIGAYNANNEAKVWLNTNGDSYFTGGRVGIGTPVPASDLTIATNASDATFKIGSVLSQNPTHPNYPLFANMTYRSDGNFEIHNNYASGDMEFHVQTGRYIKLNGNVTVDGNEVITTANVGSYTGGGVSIGTTAGTALAGNTTTITTTQANAITANTAKVGITTTQANAITANTAKVGITTAQANAITANTAKVGITTAQANKLENIEALANNYSLPTATSTVLGGVKIGANLSMVAGVVSAPVATNTVGGVTKLDGSTIKMNGSGQAYVDGTQLAAATSTSFGVVKVSFSGGTLNISTT